MNISSKQNLKSLILLVLLTGFFYLISDKFVRDVSLTESISQGTITELISFVDRVEGINFDTEFLNSLNLSSYRPFSRIVSIPTSYGRSNPFSASGSTTVTSNPTTTQPTIQPAPAPPTPVVPLEESANPPTVLLEESIDTTQSSPAAPLEESADTTPPPTVLLEESAEEAR